MKAQNDPLATHRRERYKDSRSRRVNQTKRTHRKKKEREKNIPRREKERRRFLAHGQHSTCKDRPAVHGQSVQTIPRENERAATSDPERPKERERETVEGEGMVEERQIKRERSSVGETRSETEREE